MLRCAAADVTYHRRFSRPTGHHDRGIRGTDTDEDAADVVTTHPMSSTSNDRTDRNGAPRIDASSVSPVLVRASDLNARSMPVR
jgi:hypothetical protein